jgi:glutamate-1-semialdehyde 2,1-aminomutase
MKREYSQQLYEQAMGVLPCGVNSPVRAFRSVHSTPFYVRRGKGAYLFDVDNNAYLDYVSSWGAIILGHADDSLITEIKNALEDGTSFGACHPYEIDLARMLIEAVPSMELVRLVSSGTEATMSAIRLARGAQAKNGIIKFRGCYHGHVDSLLVKAGSGLETYAIPDSAGVPADLARHTYVAEFNDIDSVAAITKDTSDIACLIIEPVMGNMGVVLPNKDFLHDIQDLCRKENILLIFDEVITGFRVAYSGAQGLYGIKPDLTCLGKIIGGGFPIGAFGGRREIMERIAPLGDVYQAGTLSGNPIAVRAGLHTLGRLKDKSPYDLLAKNLEWLRAQIIDVARKYDISYHINALSSMFTGFFSTVKVDNYETAAASSRALYEVFFQMMLDDGIFFAPSPFEAAFLTLSHGKVELEKTVEAYDRAFGHLKRLSASVRIQT